MSHVQRARWPALVLVLLAVAFSGLFRINDPDTFWHLRTGQWIVDHHAVPDIDPFSHTAGGRWLSHEWLGQLLWYGLYAAGGFAALVLGKVALLALLAALVAWIEPGARSTRPDESVTDAEWGTTTGGLALAVSLWGAACLFRFLVRPHLFSDLFTALTLGLLIRVDRYDRRRLLWVLPPLFALWGNFHRGGIVGLALVLAAVAAWSIRPDRRRLALHGLVIAALSAPALALNPGGLESLLSAVSVTGGEVMRRYLDEWQPLTPSVIARDVPFFGVMLVLWGAGRLTRRRKIDLELLAVIGTGLLAWRSIRFVPLAALALVPGLARDLSAALVRIEARFASRVRPALIELTAILAGVALVMENYVASFEPVERGAGILSWKQPVAVAGFLKADPPPGRMWNSFNFGGYLLFALAPAQKVFIDGRNDQVYPPAFFAAAIEAERDPARLLALLEAYRIGYAVLERRGPGDPAYRALSGDARWALVYWDDRAAVFARRTPEASDYLARHAYRTLEPDTAMRRLQRWSEEREPELLAAEILRSVAEAPGSIRAHRLAAALYRARGEDSEAARELAMAVELGLERGAGPR